MSGDRHPAPPTAGRNPFDEWVDVLPLWNELEEVDDVDFYVRLGEQMPRPQVELGVGYGRVARRVLPDYGVDLSAPMLERCTDALAGGRTSLLHADIRDYRLPQPAAFSYAPQNLLSLVPPEELPRVFRNIRDNTRPGGRLAFDVQLPRTNVLRARDRVQILHGRLGGTVLSHIPEVVSWERLEVLVHLVVERFDEHGVMVERRLLPPSRVWYLRPQRFRVLLEASGWHVEGVWGGFSGEGLTSTSRLQVWLARRPG